jgi:hypothetical protein
VGLICGYVFVSDQDFALGRGIKTCNQSKGCCLSATGRTQQGEKFARWNLQIKIFDRDETWKLFPDSN